MKQRDDENAAQAIGAGQSNLPSTGAVKEVDNKLFLQRDGSVLFRDRRTAPSTLVTCRRNAAGKWEYNASDYEAALMSYEELEHDEPCPEPRWVEIDEVRLLADIGRLVEGSVPEEQIRKAEAYERELRASWKLGLRGSS